MATAEVPPSINEVVIESRPKGGLDAVAEKIEYWTQEGKAPVPHRLVPARALRAWAEHGGSRH